eukprot:TRINITY_DN5271_c0_g1_i3.p1 TRINITY_DN5271_c0_g1~~TRINITY_DN5271_c0_g1_i3.p1  ORF type:complete len:2339 (-),score=478.59 TRINITY_DN5271_c0_g1_i3:83-7099(-)
MLKADKLGNSDVFVCVVARLHDSALHGLTAHAAAAVAAASTSTSTATAAPAGVAQQAAPGTAAAPASASAAATAPAAATAVQQPASASASGPQGAGSSPQGALQQQAPPAAGGAAGAQGGVVGQCAAAGCVQGAPSAGQVGAASGAAVGSGASTSPTHNTQSAVPAAASTNTPVAVAEGLLGRTRRKQLGYLPAENSPLAVYPRHADFYQPVLCALFSACQDSLDECIRILLNWLPKYATVIGPFETTDQESLRFSSFLDKAKRLLSSNKITVHVERIEKIVDLIIADILVFVLRDFQGNLTIHTVEMLRDVAFYYFSPAYRKTTDPACLTYIPHVESQWSTIVTQISPLCLGPIWSTFLKQNEKLKEEESLNLYRVVSHLQLQLSEPRRARESEEFLNQVVEQLSGKKTTAKVRLRLIQVLIGALGSAELNENPRVVELAKNILQMVKKLVHRYDELYPAGMQLRAIVLSHATVEGELDPFLVKLFKGLESRNEMRNDTCLSCILTILRGRHLPGGCGWTPKSCEIISEALDTRAPYRTLGLPADPKHLQLVCQNVFQAKQGLAKFSKSMKTLVEIALQVSAHSLKFSREHVYDFLLAKTNHPSMNHILGLRALRTLLKKRVFWRVAPSTRDQSSAHYQSPADLRELLRASVTHIAAMCKDNCDVSAWWLQNHWAMTGCHSIDIIETTPLHTLPPKISAAFVRWRNLYNINISSREQENERRRKEGATHWQDAVEKWCSLSGVPLPASDESFPPATQPQQIVDANRTKGKSKKSKAEKLLVTVLKEIMSCVPHVPSPASARFAPLFEPFFLGGFVLHEDRSVAEGCSYAMQKIILRHPADAPMLVYAFAKLLSSTDPLQAPAVQTLVHQMHGLLDLCVVCKFNTTTAATPVDDGVEWCRTSFTGEQQVFIESVLLMTMCFPNSDVQVACLDMLNDISVLSGREISLAAIMESSEHEILTRARNRHLSSASNGVPINEADVLKPTLRDLAAGSSSFVPLWHIALAQLGNAVVKQDYREMLDTVRSMIYAKLTTLKNTSVNPENTRGASFYFYLWRAYASLVLSLSGVRQSENANTSKIKKILDSERLTTIQEQLTAYLNDLWQGLMGEDSAVHTAIPFICGSTHLHSVNAVVFSLTQWWKTCSPKVNDKKRASLRRDCISILKQLTSVPNLSVVLAASEQLAANLLYFINELPSVFTSKVRKTLDPLSLLGSKATTPASPFQDTRFSPVATNMVDSSLLIANVCKALCKPLLSLSEPVCCHIVTSLPDPEVWKLQERLHVLTLTIHWAHTKDPPQKADSARGSREPAELPTSIIRRCARLAAQGIIRLGPLTGNSADQVPKNALEWAVDAEQRSFTTLGWILTFHFNSVFPDFVKQTYNTESVSVANVFLLSIYFHFCPLSLLLMPQQYPVQEEDPDHRQCIVNVGPILLHLALLHLVHARQEIRQRSLELISWLAPSTFGRNPVVAEKLGGLRSVLLRHKASAISKNTTVFQQSAIEVSRTVAKSCSVLAEDVFAEAFVRAPGMPLDKKNWLMQVLQPWCESIDLTRQNFAAETFLHNVFALFTEDLIAAGLYTAVIDFWQKLATCFANNLDTVLTYLLHVSTVSEAKMSTCKILIFAINKITAEQTLRLLTSKLSFDYVGDLPLESVECQKEKLSPAAKITAMREAAATILSDLISQSVTLTTMHLHLILNFCLLHYDVGTSKPFKQLLVTALLLFISQDTTGSPAVVALEQFVSRLNQPKCALVYVIASRKPTLCPDIVSATDFISTLCEYLVATQAAVLQGWVKELISWCTGNKDRPDIKLEIKALHIFRVLCTHTPLPDVTLRAMLCGLLESTELIETVCNSGVDATIAFDKAQELLITLGYIVPFLPVHGNTYLSLFFATSAFLYPNTLPHALLPLALNVINKLCSIKFYDHLEQSAVDAVVHKVLEATGVTFNGLQPLLYRFLLYPDCEMQAAKLLAVFIGLPDTHATIANTSPNRRVECLTALLPWLHNKIVLARHFQAPVADVVKFAGDLGHKVGKHLKWTSTAAALQKYANRDTDETEFLQDTCEELHEVGFLSDMMAGPGCIAVMKHLVQQAPSMGIAESVFQIVEFILCSHAEGTGVAYVVLLRELLLVAADEMVFSPAAQSLLEQTCEVLTEPIDSTVDVIPQALDPVYVVPPNYKPSTVLRAIVERSLGLAFSCRNSIHLANQDIGRELSLFVEDPEAPKDSQKVGPGDITPMHRGARHHAGLEAADQAPQQMQPQMVSTPQVAPSPSLVAPAQAAPPAEEEEASGSFSGSGSGSSSGSRSESFSESSFSGSTASRSTATSTHGDDDVPSDFPNPPANPPPADL